MQTDNCEGGGGAEDGKGASKNEGESGEGAGARPNSLRNALAAAHTARQMLRSWHLPGSRSSSPTAVLPLTPVMHSGINLTVKRELEDDDGGT